MANRNELQKELATMAERVESQMLDDTRKMDVRRTISALREQVDADKVTTATLNGISALRAELGMPMDLARPQDGAPQAVAKPGENPDVAKGAQSEAAPQADVSIEARMKAEKEKIREAMKSLDARAIEGGNKILEEFLRLPLLTDAHRTLMRGYNGVLLLENLQNANYKLVLGSDQNVSIVPLDAERSDDDHRAKGAELAQKITALLRSKSMDIDTLRTGMLYRSESFASYVRGTLTSDGKIAGKQRDLAGYQESIGLGNFRLDLRDWKKIPEYRVGGYETSCFPSQDKSGKPIEGQYDIRIDDSSTNDTIITGVPRHLDLARFFASVNAIYGKKVLPSGGEVSYETLVKDLPVVPVRLDPEDYFRFLLNKKDSKQKLSPAEEMLIASGGMFQSYGVMAQAVEQFPNLGRISTDAKKHAQAMAKWLAASADAAPGEGAKSEPKKPHEEGNTDNESSDGAVSTTTGAIGGAIGQLGGTIGKILGVAGSEGAKVVMDTFRSATKEGGLWGAATVIAGLLYGINKLGFWGSIATFLGLGTTSGAMNGKLDDVPDRLEKVFDRLWNIGNGSGASTTPQQGGADAQKPAEPAKPAAPENSQLTPSQKKATEKAMNDTDIKERIVKHLKTPENEQGKMEDYLKFINSDSFQNQKLSGLIFTDDRETSIFANTPENRLAMRIPPELNPIILKRILRTYITGKSAFETPASWVSEWTKERQDFIWSHPEAQYKEKTLKELIQEINQ